MDRSAAKRIADWNEFHEHMDEKKLREEVQAHAGAGIGSRSGGSNYAFADGSVRFIKFGRVMNPINLWAVMPDVRAAGY